ncbi:unnamed protein product [Aphis gossypii]|uniref:Uncharacterized protein n=1 Tax=Aphis gossypii TaxID=80765 RepID=A0A9P0J6U3_APHGO|nr:unnamed protein product [Aphis gossypii]
MTTTTTTTSAVSSWPLSPAPAPTSNTQLRFRSRSPVPFSLHSALALHTRPTTTTTLRRSFGSRVPYRSRCGGNRSRHALGHCRFLIAVCSRTPRSPSRPSSENTRTAADFAGPFVSTVRRHDDDSRPTTTYNCPDVEYRVGEDAGGRTATTTFAHTPRETCVERENIVSHTGPYHSSPCVQFKQLDGELIRAGMSILRRVRPARRQRRQNYSYH